MDQQVALTLYEHELVQNAAMMHAKNSIIRKVSDLFALISIEYAKEAQRKLPLVIASVAPKISRGEQYLGLPYVMLDYPRNFSKNNTFAIRTFFWWGHFFSIHLQLSGSFQQQYTTALATAITNGKFDEWYAGIHENEWHHHFQEDNYQLITRNTHFDLSQRPFIKLAKKIPLDEWDSVEIFLKENFNVLIDVICC